MFAKKALIIIFFGGFIFYVYLPIIRKFRYFEIRPLVSWTSKLRDSTVPIAMKSFTFLRYLYTGNAATLYGFLVKKVTFFGIRKCYKFMQQNADNI